MSELPAFDAHAFAATARGLEKPLGDIRRLASLLSALVECALSSEEPRGHGSVAVHMTKDVRDDLEWLTFEIDRRARDVDDLYIDAHNAGCGAKP